MSKAFKTIKSGSVKIPIYRNKHPHAASGWVFTASYYIDGRRRQKQGTSLDAIEAEAKRIAGNLSAGKAEAAEFSTNDREELLAARRICGDVPLLSALDEYMAARSLVDGSLLSAAKLWAQSQNRGVSPKHVRDVVAEYLQVKEAAGKHVGQNHRSEFRNIITDFGDRLIHEITTQEINRWLQKRSNPWTMLTYRKRIIAIFRWAQGYGYVSKAGKTAAEYSESPSTPVAPIGIMTPDALESLFRVTVEKSPRDVPALVLSAMCGMRRKEVHHQLWEDINIERGFLSVSAAKKGTFSYRMIPLCEAACKWLAGYIRTHGLVCEGLSVDRVRKCGREAGLCLPENAFRHSFVSYRVAVTQDRGKVALEAGHSEKTLIKHYKENVTVDDAEAWFGIFPDARAR
jgi:integrase